jgi:hypothetical protein
MQLIRNFIFEDKDGSICDIPYIHKELRNEYPHISKEHTIVKAKTFLKKMVASEKLTEFRGRYSLTDSEKDKIIDFRKPQKSKSKKIAEKIPPISKLKEVVLVGSNHEETKSERDIKVATRKSRRLNIHLFIVPLVISAFDWIPIAPFPNFSNGQRV